MSAQGLRALQYWEMYQNVSSDSFLKILTFKLR